MGIFFDVVATTAAALAAVPDAADDAVFSFVFELRIPLTDPHISVNERFV